jgi:hypothetical protein
MVHRLSAFRHHRDVSVPRTPFEPKSIATALTVKKLWHAYCTQQPHAHENRSPWVAIKASDNIGTPRNFAKLGRIRAAAVINRWLVSVVVQPLFKPSRARPCTCAVLALQISDILTGRIQCYVGPPFIVHPRGHRKWGSNNLASTP